MQAETTAQDRDGRLVARVYRGKREANAELVTLDYAWAAGRYLRQEDSGCCTFETAAREARSGVWRLTPHQLIAPWGWRRRKKLRAFTDYSQETPASCVASLWLREPVFLCVARRKAPGVSRMETSVSVLEADVRGKLLIAQRTPPVCPRCLRRGPGRGRS